jgi:hypothetical protein
VVGGHRCSRGQKLNCVRIVVGATAGDESLLVSRLRTQALINQSETTTRISFRGYLRSAEADRIWRSRRQDGDAALNDLKQQTV